MEVISVNNSNRIRDYISFSDKVYENNPNYRNTMETIKRRILTGKGVITNNSIIRPIMIIDSGEIVAVCSYALVDRMKDILQITFFEALDKQEKAIELMIDYGKRMARDLGIKEILAGLNIHVNYGLGYLADKFDETQSFGSSYNPSYYIDYFMRYAKEGINLVSYKASLDDFDYGINHKLIDRVTKKYNVRKVNFNNLKKEAEIYTQLNNEAFKNHKFYYERRFEEDLELFSEFKILLKEENLLFLEHEGNPVGFMLWYPDFNELINPGEKLGIKTVIKYRLFQQKIEKFKIVELGVIPAHQKNGAVMALFKKCREIVKDRYKFCESGWILEDNKDSRGFGYRWTSNVHKHFKVFLIDV